MNTQVCSEFWCWPYKLDNTSLIVNKQLNDKERVAAALENPFLLQTVEERLSSMEMITLNI